MADLTLGEIASMRDLNRGILITEITCVTNDLLDETLLAEVTIVAGVEVNVGDLMLHLMVEVEVDMPHVVKMHDHRTIVVAAGMVSFQSIGRMMARVWEAQFRRYAAIVSLRMIALWKFAMECMPSDLFCEENLKKVLLHRPTARSFVRFA